MKNEIITIYSRDEMKNIFIEGLKEYEAMKAALPSKEITFSINQVAKRIRRSHSTVKQLIKKGLLKPTSDQRRISAYALNEYLSNCQK